MEDLIGKKIQLYPGDTYSKYGIIKKWTEHGIVIKITESDASAYKVNSEYYISHSKSLIFKIL